MRGHRRRILAGVGVTIAIAAVAASVFLLTRSGSSFASASGPSAEDVKAVLDAARAPIGTDATYEDDLYGFRLRYPSQRWEVTLGDSQAPHRIQLQTTNERSGAVNDRSDPSAEITIQAYLPEPVSDARCDEPAQSQVGGYPAFICTYSYGNNYKNFEPTPQEWSVISVKVTLDNGPVYISAAILKPLGEGDPSSVLDQLRIHAAEVTEIIKSFEVTVPAPPS